MVTTQAFLPDSFSGEGIEAGGHSAVVYKENLFADQERRRQERNAFGIGPDDFVLLQFAVTGRTA